MRMIRGSTLDPADSAYKWVDQGEVLESSLGDDFNAIDPNIFIDTDGSTWMTYGSYRDDVERRVIEVLRAQLERRVANIAADQPF